MWGRRAGTESTYTRVEAVHFAAEAFIFFQCDVTSTAYRRGVGSVVGRREGHGALGCEFGSDEDVGCCMKIAKRVSTDKAAVCSEGDITLKHTSTHPCTGLRGLGCLFRDLKGSATTVSYAPACDLKWPILTTLELGLERSFRHVLENKVRTWPIGDVVVLLWGGLRKLSVVPVFPFSWSDRRGSDKVDSGQSRDELRN
jgi:hypothetical protein